MSRLHLMFGLVVAGRRAAGCCAAADLDRDGIPDEWESKIIKVQFADGHTSSIDLRSASPHRKDVIVWITWMDCEGHTHRPIRNLDKASGNSGMALDPTPLSRVVQAFRDSPVLNPDGSKGVNLILLYAEKPLPEVQMLGGVDGNGDYVWDNLEKLRAAQPRYRRRSLRMWSTNAVSSIRWVVRPGSIPGCHDRFPVWSFWFPSAARTTWSAHPTPKLALSCTSWGTTWV